MEHIIRLLYRPLFECEGETFTLSDLTKVAMGTIAFLAYSGLAQRILGETTINGH